MVTAMSATMKVVPSEVKTESNDANKERYKRFQDQKETLAGNPDTIVWIPFSGSHGFKVAKILRLIDKEVTLKRRKAGFGLTIDQVKQYILQVREVADETWNDVRELIPRLHSIPLERVHELNNDVSEKRQMAKISRSAAILPRSVEVGYLVMAVKQIEERGLLLQQQDLDALTKLTDTYKNISDRLIKLADKLSK